MKVPEVGLFNPLHSMQITEKMSFANESSLIRWPKCGDRRACPKSAPEHRVWGYPCAKEAGCFKARGRGTGAEVMRVLCVKVINLHSSSQNSCSENSRVGMI
jgi:hypothetical protein